MVFLLDWKYSGTTHQEIAKEAKKALPCIRKYARASRSSSWANPASFLMLPCGEKFLKASIQAAGKCKSATLFVCIGIGGSNLGTMASADFLFGKSHNLLNTKKQIVFADTTDPDYLHEVSQIVRLHLGKKHRVVFNIVSKSGSTTETIANFEALYCAIPASQKKMVRIYATTDAGSPLHKIASKKGWKTLPIPKGVGGRYSVLSPVGLFPLAWLGADVRALLFGASKMLPHCLSNDIRKNPALVQAALLSLNCKAGRNIHGTFIFSKHMDSYGLWWRQLLAESSGKKGRGITPTVSIGSTDLHSQAQLYLGGPKDKLFRFISISSPSYDQFLLKTGALSPISKNILGRSTSSIYSILLESIKSAFNKKHIPYYTIELPGRNEESLGALLLFDMASVILFCNLIGVDPFGQPSVEDYKKIARKMLAKK